MARKSLLYYLFSQKKLPLYQDANGHVQEGTENLLKPDGQPAHLEYSPEGWKDTLIKYARSIQYWGMFRSYTAPMKFVKDGAAILHKLMWTFGVEAICYFGILRLDRTQLPYAYENFYLSEINFSKYKKTARGVNAEAMEGGLSKLLKSNESTVYEIPIDTDEEHINVLMDGMEFDFNRTMGVVTDQPVTGTGNFFLGLVETAREGSALDVQFQDVLPVLAVPYPNDYYSAKTDVVQSIQIKGTIKVYYNKSVTPFIKAETNDGVSGTFLTQTTLWSAAGTAGTTVDVDIDTTIAMPVNNRLHIKLSGGSGADPTTQYTIKSGELKFNYVYRHASTYVKAIYPYRLLEKIVEKMTNGAYGIQSDWLSTFKSIAITSGDALRGIVTDNSDPDNLIKGAVIKTSLLDFFKSMNRWGAGLGIEGVRPTVDDKLLFERFSHFFQGTITADIGEVSNAELSVAEDIVFNTIKAGYEKQDYSDANGRYEMNQGQEWTTPHTKIVRELNLVSPYRADAFGIELLRINYDQKKSSDSDSDNDTFFLSIETTSQVDTGADPDITYYNLYRPAYTDVTGIPHPDSAFNTELTPKKSILENGAYIRSILDLLDGDVIKFRSADKNSDFSTTLAGVTILEKEDIQIGTLPDRLFRPYYITFTTKVPVNLMALIKAVPYGKIQFTVDGVTFYGYLMDGGIRPAMNDTQVWKLLSAAENDLSKFNTGD